MKLTFFLLSLSLPAQINVQVYNNAAIPEELLQRALRVTRSLFEREGIELRWEVCRPTCEEGGASYIVGMAGGKIEIPARAALGFAMLRTGKGNRAVISVPRVSVFSDLTFTPLPVALGHAIAHELGHLVSGSSQHSTGLMQAMWDKNAVDRMRRGVLRFAKADVAAMRR